MKTTKKNLRRIIRGLILKEGPNDPTSWPDPPAHTLNQDRAGTTRSELEPRRFRSKDEAEDAAVDMVFGDDPNQRLGGDLPYEIRIVSIAGEYALYAMADHTDRYDGEGREIAAVPRGGSIRYGRRIG